METDIWVRHLYTQQRQLLGFEGRRGMQAPSVEAGYQLEEIPKAQEGHRISLVIED